MLPFQRMTRIRQILQLRPRLLKPGPFLLKPLSLALGQARCAQGMRGPEKLPRREDTQALTSWADPFELPVDELDPPAKFEAEMNRQAQESDMLQEMISQRGGGIKCAVALAKLGVESRSDLNYVTDQDLISQGIAAVTARKLLNGYGTGAARSQPSQLPAASCSPEETMKLMAKKGVVSADRSTGQIICSSFLGGALLGWGCALTTVVAGGSATLLADAPGLLALLTGAVFPVGLSMVVLSGSELLTGNFVTMTLPAWTHPGVKKEQVASNTWRVWCISGAGNLAGSLCIACAIYSLSVVQPGTPAALWLAALAVKKCSLGAGVAIGKGMCANWLVNIAIFQASSAHTPSGKIASLWLPIMTFVALGLEHSIANMFLLPLGMLVGADVSIIDIASNVGLVAVGNALGAIIFVGMVQRYSLLRNMVYAKPV
ncbi:unnamed protein product [Polarella glacialis]|nr:unnamed protein product [Polarella glacialis]